MARSSPPTVSKTMAGRLNSASPRWGGTRGSLSNEGSTSTSTLKTAPSTNRRVGSAVSSPRGYSPTGGGGSNASRRYSTARDQQGARDGMTEFSQHSTAGPITKGMRSIEADCTDVGQEEPSEDSGRIRVAVRVRPFSEKEKLAGTRCVISMIGNQTKILDPTYFDSEEDGSSPDDRSMWERTFNFDHSFWSHSGGRRGGKSGGAAAGEGGECFSSQADVHHALGNFLLDNACRGFNCSLFAYGQTGSGKTYTMLGDSSELTSAAGEGTAGLIPRICVELFQRFGLSGGGMENASEYASCGNGQASVKVSFCEIYNEQVRDLFGGGGSGHSLRVREHPTKGAFVEGLSARPVGCYQQVQQLLEDGMSSRATAATAMNEVSSRSHAIFTIHITVTFTTKLSHSGGGREDRGASVGVGAEDDISSRTSKICLVDLAGSERANATGAKGDRLREAANINKSLSTLGDVIKALAKRAGSGRGSGNAAAGSNSSESFIPFRNSMLTWLLKDSIGGNSKTVMLAAISPVAEAYQETMSTLRYVERAKEIVNAVAVNDASASPLVGKLREEVRALQELLEEKETAIAENNAKEAMLTAALERARAGDDEKVLKALADADRLEAALHVAMRDIEKLRAAADKAATTQKELEDQAERHAVEFEECLKYHEDEMRRVKEEASEILAFEVGLAKDHASEERSMLQAQWEEALEMERVKMSEAHQDKMEAELARCRVENERDLKRAAEEAARANEVAFAKISELRETHAVELAKSAAAVEDLLAEQVESLREKLESERQEEMVKISETHAEETRRLGENFESEREVELKKMIQLHGKEMQRLRDSFESEREVEMTKAREAHAEESRCLRESFKLEMEMERKQATEKRLAEETERDAELQGKLAKATAVATETGEASLKGLRAQHDASLLKLSEEHAVAVSEAVKDAVESLRIEHKNEMSAVQAAGEAALREALQEESTRSAKETYEKTEAAISALQAEHQQELADLTSASEEAVENTRNEAETRFAKEFGKASDEIARLREELQFLRKSHVEELASERQKHDVELRHVIEIERSKAEAKLVKTECESATAIEELKLKTEEARAAQDEKYQQEVRAVKEEREAKIKVLQAESKLRERQALDALASEHETLLSEVKAEKDNLIAILEKKNEEEVADAEKRWTAKMEEVIASAEKKILDDVESVERRAAATLAAEEDKHRDEFARREREVQREIESIRATAENKRVSDLAAAEDTLSRSLAEAKNEHDAVIAALNTQHRGELDRSFETHRLNMNLLAAEAKEKEASASDANKTLASALSAAEEELARVTTAKEAQYQDELRSAKEEHNSALASALSAAKEEQAASITALSAQHQQEMRRLHDKHNETISSTLAAAKEEQRAVIAENDNMHQEEIRRAQEEHRTNLALALSAAEEERAAITLGQEEQHQEKLRMAREEHREALASALSAAKAEYVEEKSEREAQHQRELRRAQEEHQKALAAELSAAKEEQAVITLEDEEMHQEELRRVKEERNETLASALSVVKQQHAAATTAQAARYEEKLRRAQEAHKAELGRVNDAAESLRRADLALLERERAQTDDKIKEISEAFERQTKTERDKVAATLIDVKSAHQAEVERLRAEHTDEMASAVAQIGEQREAEVAEAESKLKSSVDAIREQMADEKAKFISGHLLEMRKVKEEGSAERERTSREAAERSKAQSQKAAAELNEAKLAHLRDLQAAAASAEDARKVELAAVNEKLALTTSRLQSELENTIAHIKEEHQEELRKISEEMEAEKGAISKAADEKHSRALADANTAQERKLQDVLQAERSFHATVVEAETKTLRETLESEHRQAFAVLEETHLAAMKELKDRSQEAIEELEEKVESAQAAAADAQASADELATRAEALDEMLKASVGSKEEELAGHRSRMAQLQGFISRRGASSGDDSSKLSSPAARSLQQRFSDLRAIACESQAAALKGDGGDTGLGTFTSKGEAEGLTTERYAQELEIALMRATIDAAVARQDHLEADLQCQGVTRQLVGLKLVHAQLRECLEDTQVKLEHKSQSAARRLLNSAARLAHEFAKPDRFSTQRPHGSPRSTKPRAMSSQHPVGRSPLSSTRSGAFRRKRNPERGSEPAATADVVSNDQVFVDITATM